MLAGALSRLQTPTLVNVPNSRAERIWNLHPSCPQKRLLPKKRRLQLIAIHFATLRRRLFHMYLVKRR